MKKFGKINLISLLVLACLSIATISTSIASVVASTLVYDANNYFPVTYEDTAYSCSSTFNCYTIDDTVPGVSNPIAVSWGGANRTTASEFQVPATLTKSGTTYNVVAIAKGGFARCTMQRIHLPTSIKEIQEEAFAYCQSLIDFDIPYQLTEIAPSTFLDCRKLENIYYGSNTGARQFGHDNLTTIGDHAFDSCVSLQNFYCPKNTTYFGESCFQKCRTLANFYFPSAVDSNGDPTETVASIANHITIRPYAFAECVSLLFCYFEKNMQEIDDHAFAGCNTDLAFYYNGTSEPTFKRTVDGNQVTQSHWRDKNIATNLTDKYRFVPNQATIHADDTYPCLRYTIENTRRKLDCGVQDQTSVYVIGDANHETVDAYAVLYKFDTPVVDVPGCYTVSTGTLTIPETVDGYPVKVIKEQMFANHTEIKVVNFSANLVQICHEAFYKCSNITTLNFNPCTSLKEVSYKAFNDLSTKMSKVTSLSLPNCLEYVGDCGFCGFDKVTSFSFTTTNGSSHLKVIGDAGFRYLGQNAGGGKFNITIPKSLNDADADAAYLNHTMGGQYPHNNYSHRYAIGKYAFAEAKGILAAEMEEDPDHLNDNSYTTSMFSNSFKDSSNMIRFKSNYNLMVLGKDSFKGCSNLRELFLPTNKGNLAGVAYPWCFDEDNDTTYGGTLFTGACPDLVIYIYGSEAPGNLDSVTFSSDLEDAAKRSLWNAESGVVYIDELGTVTDDITAKNSSTGFMRTRIPTFYNVDYENDGIVYWNPKTNAIQNIAPTNANDYKNGNYASIVKVTHDDGVNPVTYTYTFARYFCDVANAKGTSKIDLTKISGVSDKGLSGSNNKLTVIGDEAFAVTTVLDGNTANKYQGLYFVLPDSVTEIGERSFYRRTKTSGNNASSNNNYYGVRVVTYRDSSNGKIYKGDGTTFADDSAYDTYINATPASNDGYCYLPRGVTSIQKNAFYNNIFTTINIGSSISFIGNGAFMVINTSSASRLKTTTVTIGSNSYFETDANGIYYKGGGAAKRMLVYQYGNPAANTSITVSTGTKAIGFHAFVNSGYTNVDLDDSVQVIYGGGFQNNIALKKVTGLSELRYIGSMKNASQGEYTPRDSWTDDSYTEIWDSTVDAHFNNTDYRRYSYKYRPIYESLYGAFKGCTSLEEFDFTSMDSSLRKIGRSAFEGCSKLYKVTDGTKTYKYYTYSVTMSGSSVSSRSIALTKEYTNGVGVDSSANVGVLDLSGCTSLRSIGSGAFSSCNNIRAIHLPVSQPDKTKESKLYVGFDPEIDKVNAGGDPAANKLVYRGKITTGSNKMILIGETYKQANPNDASGTKLRANKHYPSGYFDSNPVYYHLDDGGDIYGSTSASYKKYWTEYNGCYILFEDIYAATDWFNGSNADAQKALVVAP